MARLRFGMNTLLAAGTGILVANPAFAASWQMGVSYGGNTNMNLYVPDTLDESPGIVVALHSCGNQYESDSQNYVKTSADEYGFIIIQPTNGNPDCWTADAGQDGEKPDIVAMVNYVLENNNGDASRVYAVGASSGACMTLALMATHPDVFSGGSVLAGVPYGAWSAGGSCSVCSQAASSKSEEEWGNIVRQNAPANFAGPWPKIQLWHGTSDPTLLPGWLAESEKQWKNVHGLTSDGMSVDAPAGWTRKEYSDDSGVVLQVNSGAGKDHYLPDDVPQADIVTFFGLDSDTASGPSTDDSGSTSGSTDTSTATGGSASSGTSTGADSSESAGPTGSTTSDATTSASGGTGAPTSGPSGGTSTTTATTAPTTSPSASTSVPAPSSTSTTTTAAPTGSSNSGNTSTSTASTSGPVNSSESTDAGCGCSVGAGSTDTSRNVLAGLAVVGLAALFGKRRRS